MIDPATFLENIEINRKKEAEAPDPSEEFVKEQFSSVVMELKSVAERIETAVNKLSTVEVKNQPKSISTPDVKDVTKAVKGIKIPTTDMKPTEKRLDTLTEAVKAIPSVDTVQVTNLDKEITQKLSKDLEKINQAINKLEMNPKVTVKPAAVTVQKPNLDPITKGLKAIKKSVDDKPLPMIPTTQTDPLIRFVASDVDDEDGSGNDLTTQYFGFLANDGEWFIRRYIINTQPKTMRFAWGKGNYLTNWNNRASLTYNLYTT